MNTKSLLFLVGTLGLTIAAIPSSVYADEDGRFRAFPGGGSAASAWVLDSKDGVMYFCSAQNKVEPSCKPARLERLVSPSSSDKDSSDKKQ